MFREQFLRIRFVIAIAASLLGASSAHAEKAGFEYFKTTAVDSFHALDITTDVLYSIAPNPPFINLPDQENKEQYFRIIDIVVEEADDDGWQFSAAFIRNSGPYQRKSWFLYDLTADEVWQCQQVKGWLAIDIEHAHYKDASGNYLTRYAIVLVECPEEHSWFAALNATPEQVEQYQRRGHRPIDLDAFDESLWLDYPMAELLEYDGIFVENVGANYLPTEAFFCDADDIEAMAAAGWQAIDVQLAPYNYTFFHPEVEFHAVFVQTFNPCWIQLDGDSADFEDYEESFGRMIDLKQDYPNHMATFLGQ